MSGPLYEFTGEDSARPRPKWLIAVVALPVVLAAAWALVRWDRVRTERLVKESFELETDLHNDVVIANAQVPEVPEECVRFLANYPRLQVVSLSGTTKVSGGLRSLREIDDLNVLSLRGCAWVDGQQAAWLSELTDLKELDLSDTRVADAALRAISKLPRLSKLQFEHCEGITDAGLEICAGMNQLRELWPGGAGCSLADLVALRERRSDLSLHVNPSAVRLSTSEDIQALSDLLRLNQNFGFGNPFQISYGGNAEHIEETWTSLKLHGPAAVRSLATVLPLTPNLTALSLHDTTLTTEEFPFDQMPPGLRRLHIENTQISESFLRTLNQHTALEQLTLTDVAIDGVDRSVGHYTTLELIHVDETQSRVQFRGAVAGRSLANVFPLTPKLTDLTLQDTTIATDHFPFDLVPPGLRSLTIWNTPVSESFLRMLSQHIALERLSLYDVAVRESLLRVLSQHTALETLSLSDVAIDGVDLADPVLAHFTTVKSMDLRNVTVDGVDLTDPALEPLTAQLHEQLPHTSVTISSSASNKSISWYGPPRVTPTDYSD